jgi:hypothetical protein
MMLRKQFSPKAVKRVAPAWQHACGWFAITGQVRRGRIGREVRGREAFGLRRPEPALWLERRTTRRHALSLRRDGKAVTALRSVTAVQTLARVPERFGGRRPKPFRRFACGDLPAIASAE